MPEVELRPPALELLPTYEDALRRGWSPDTIRLDAAAQEELARIAEDPVAFVASLNDPDPGGRLVPQPDGSLKPRIPGYRRWIWDGEFCGSLSFRWQPGGAALPPHVQGHIGYSVVAWKRGRGYATRALGLILPEARALGLPYVELVTDEDNLASQRTIAANGGELVEAFDLPGVHGTDRKLRYRIAL